MILYLPVGFEELKLIAASEYTAFPPRPSEQPIFHPVLNFEYADEIARDWNANTAPYVGFVACFELEQTYADTLEIHTVGEKSHQELWIMADELDNFNDHIQGKIGIIASYGRDNILKELDL